MARAELTLADVARHLPAGWACSHTPGGGWTAVRRADGHEVHGVTALDVVAAACAADRDDPPPSADELAADAWWLAELDDLVAAERPVRPTGRAA